MCNYLVHPPKINEESGQRESELYIRRTNFKPIFYVFVHILTFLRLSQNTHNKKKVHTNTKRSKCFVLLQTSACLHNNNNKFGTSHRGPSIGKFSLKNKQTKPALAGSPPCPACFVKISKISFLKHQTNILQIRKQKKICDATRSRTLIQATPEETLLFFYL